MVEKAEIIVAGEVGEGEVLVFTGYFPCVTRIKVHKEIRSNFRSVLLDVQSFTVKPVFERPFAHHMVLFLRLSQNSTKAYPTMPIGIMGSNNLALFGLACEQAPSEFGKKIR